MSSGFYKYENPIMLHGTVVLDMNYELRSEQNEEYEYPIDGWYWFNTEDEAYEFFGAENPVKDEEDN